MPERRTRVGWTTILTLAAIGCASDERPPAPADGAGSAGAHVVVIRMTDAMRFEPEHPTIAAGDTVVWINEGQMPHTATDKPGLAGVPEHNVLPDGAEPWDSGLLDPGQSYRQVVTTEGEYTYLCFLHEAAGMVGRITVTESRQ